MADRYDELGEELLNLLRPGFGGRPAPEFVARVRALANEMLRIHSDGYVRQKVLSMMEWVNKACSHRKHAPWGLRQVEEMAYSDAYRIANARLD